MTRELDVITDATAMCELLKFQLPQKKILRNIETTKIMHKCNKYIENYWGGTQ